MDRNYHVRLYVIENVDDEIETGCWGPMTEDEADQWVDRYLARLRKTGGNPLIRLFICHMATPWTPEITNPQPNSTQVEYNVERPQRRSVGGAN